MALEPAILNIDIDFTNKPELVGNQFVVQNFVGSSDIKTNMQSYMSVNDIKSKLNLKRKYVGQMTNSSEQILPFYRRLVDKDVVSPGKFSFIHIGAHCNLYSFGGHVEYEFKKEMEDYEGHQAFAYLFKEKFVDNITWVYPDYFTEERLDLHFEGMDYIKRNGYYIVSINQGLRFVVKPIKWSEFIPTKYSWKAISIITNKHTSNFKPEDLKSLKDMIF